MGAASTSSGGRRARAGGVPVQDGALDSRALLDIICASGFSTRDEADRASGRGVGMAVVRDTVEGLGGTLAVEHAPGRGTTFRMTLPLTLAITDAIIAHVGDQIFAVPQTAVREVIEVDARVAVARSSATSCCRIAAARCRSSACPRCSRSRSLPRPRFHAIVVGTGLAAVGLLVDRIAGQREIVVKTITDPLIRVDGVSGATELGDGRLVLILDVAALSRTLRHRATSDRWSVGMSDMSVATPRVRRPRPRRPTSCSASPGRPTRLKSDQVLHIEMIEHVTPVPNAPAFVEGVVFSRGQVVPVINLRARFGFERAGMNGRTRLLVVQHEGRRVGLLADEAREFVRISDAAIRPPHEAIGGLSGNYLAGCGDARPANRADSECTGSRRDRAHHDGLSQVGEAACLQGEGRWQSATETGTAHGRSDAACATRRATSPARCRASPR